jgi:hypothetical protein
MGKTQAHHRWDKRLSRPTWRQSLVYRRALLCAALKVARDVALTPWPDAPLVVKAQRLRLATAVDKVWPMVIDEDGSAWE